MYTNANFWRDMAILAGSWIVAGYSLIRWMDSESNEYGGCDPRYC